MNRFIKDPEDSIRFLNQKKEKDRRLSLIVLILQNDWIKEKGENHAKIFS
jgi:hypothetical protein